MVVSVAGAGATLRASSQPSRPAVISFASGVHLLRGNFVLGIPPDGNTILLQGSEGLVVVDTGRHLEHTQRILDFAKAAKLPVKAVVNTHWHLDHVGGNLLLRREFPQLRVLATSAIEQAMTGFLAEYRRSLEKALEKAARESEAGKAARAELALIDAGKALFPDEPVVAAGRRSLAGREIDIAIESHAVTASDLWLLDRASRTLVAGDLVTLPAPFFDTACPMRWKESLARLAAADFERLVPGHGPPLSAKQFATYRAAFDGLLACAASPRPKQECQDEWLRSAGDLVPAAEHKLANVLLDYYLDHHLRDPARTAKLCAAAGG
jgi:glyoxylase-like metal-dependent hydrolase (beta-lactamase superfamily II)